MMHKRHEICSDYIFQGEKCDSTEVKLKKTCKHKIQTQLLIVLYLITYYV